MRGLIVRGLSVLLTGCMAASAYAAPLPTGGIAPDEVAAILKARNLPVKFGKDGEGETKIESKSEGDHFVVYFYGCKSGRCTSIQFSKGYNLENGIELEALNKWNREYRFGRAFRDDEKDPWLQMDVDLERGSTTESVDNNLETWLAVLSAFSQEIGWNGDAEDEAS